MLQIDLISMNTKKEEDYFYLIKKVDSVFRAYLSIIKTYI